MSQLTRVTCVLACAIAVSASVFAGPPIQSFDVGHTISKVRTANASGHMLIVGSSYEGAILAISEQGKTLWKNNLSGFMNHDVWCEDITGDGNDEILTANADGHVYCLNSQGNSLWKFKVNEAPMYSVCVVHQGDEPHVVCGGFDNNVYYLSAGGEQVQMLPSKQYSIAKPFKGTQWKPKPPDKLHFANFLRKRVVSGQDETLVIHGCMNAMQDKGILYLFDPLAEKPNSTIKVTAPRVIGDLHVTGDGTEILMGTSAHAKDSAMIVFDVATEKSRLFKVRDLRKDVDLRGYRVLQPMEMPQGSSHKYLIVDGPQILLVPHDLKVRNTEVLRGKYSFNDVWNDLGNSRVILASSQSGGSCIHLVDLKNPQWKQAYEKLQPPGNIEKIINASQLVRAKVRSFDRPQWEREPLPVYMMSETITDSVAPLVKRISKNSSSPVFLGHKFSNEVEDYDRSDISSEKYKEARDRRRKYTQTSEEAVEFLTSMYKGYPGGAFWAGHGNDPCMFSMETLKKVLDAADGKRSVFIFPELEDHSDDFVKLMDDRIYPLAEYCRNRNGHIYVRTKHTFWHGGVYFPAWRRLLSGEFADVFVPSMEETTDKSMDTTIAGRLGIWSSGAVDSWGSRCAMDNASYDRGREHSNQMLPNHFLRTMIYYISNGSTYIDNYAVDQDYMSLLWELIESGALYVPKRNEIISYSPVHLSMLEPDHDYIVEGINVKWSTFFDAEKEASRPMVFSRLNGSWPGAPVTEWDFSAYASGAKERRLHFLPNYENGLVMITPPQDGVGADKDAPRGRLSDHLHPIYKNILKEYYTDGRHYYTADGQKEPADKYYKTIAADIKESATRIPITVEGDVAWVAAQSLPTHIRLTLIDSGYINPKNRVAKVKFHTIKPKAMKDVLMGNRFDVSDPDGVEITIPCGMFRFIDVELSEPLGQK